MTQNQSTKISTVQRFRKEHPCPVCGGYGEARRGQGERCYGFLSSDGAYAHCTREEHAGNIEMNPKTEAFPHKLTGECRCGTQHGPDDNMVKFTKRAKPRITTTYDYTDESGKLLYQAVRYEEPKDFNQRRPDGKGGWEWSLNGTRRVLYHLPELLKADEDAVVYLCEGEKDADRLRSEGLIATTNAMGARKWRDEYTDTLTGRHVVLLEDNDIDGRKHTETVVSALSGKAASVKVLKLPGLPEKGDVSDFLDNGGTVEELKRLTNEASEWGEDDSNNSDKWDSWDGWDSFSKEQEFTLVPNFPVDTLPPNCAELVRQAADSLLCPPELVGLPVLTVLSGALGYTRVLRIKQGWETSACLYGAVVDEPGSRKSPAASFANAPLEKLQAELRLDYKKERQTFDADMRQHALDKKRAAKEDRAEPEPPAPPTLKRCIVDDITVEALAVRLEENPHGFLSAHDELTGFIRGLDQYKSGGKGNARQSYLKMWSNAAIIVDRKGNGEPIVIPKPFVTLQGAIQPGVLHEIGSGRDDGFLDRWLFAYPESVPGGYSNKTVDLKTAKAYKDVVYGLWEKAAAVEEDGTPMPHIVSMDREAKELFVAEANALAEEARSPGFPSRLRGPWSKLDTQLARLALIIAVTRGVEEGQEAQQVTGADMKNALRLLEYFKFTTQKAYGQLFEANADDTLGSALGTLLADSGYVYSGTISQLMKQLPSNVLPGTPEALSKAIRRIAQKSPGFNIRSRKSGSKRIITLTLEKTVPTVPTVPNNDDIIEGEL